MRAQPGRKYAGAGPTVKSDANIKTQPDKAAHSGLEGALGYAELGAMMPVSGGHYVYLQECYGPVWGFLCGWAFALVVAGAAIAWLAVSFSITLGYFVRLGPVASKILALVLIAALSWV